MKELIVLGIGNRLMTDDGIGIHIVEELQKINTNKDIQYVVGETDVYFCLNQIENALMTIIIDAAYLYKEAGSISVASLDKLNENPVYPISLHDTHLLDLVRKSGQNIKGLLIGIQPYEIDFGTSLSSVLKSKIIGIIFDVNNIIQDFVKNKIASYD